MEKVIINNDSQYAIEEHEQTPFTSTVEDPNPTPSSFFTRVKALIALMRPKQWTKNGAVFIGLVFASELFHLYPLIRAIVAFITFCFVSSTIYVLNDLLDIEKDRLHPTKRFRPLASGVLPTSWAKAALIGLLGVCCVLTFVLFLIPSPPDIYRSLGGANVLFALSIIAYLVMMVFYSFRLKHVVLIDVFCIAAGFVLRIIAGTVVIPVVISPWLYLVTCFLSLFMGFGKRRHELVLLQGQAGSHRKILKEYSIPMLDQMITVVVSGTLMSYSLYTVQGQTGNHRLMITVPFVLYGVFRYLYLVYMHMDGGSPDEILLRDRHILAAVLLCVITVIAVLYLLPHP
ncbi:decaprenyl-phosphate phosphoribosyltransferase [Dictyobacter formicarum]|uniref:Decaprenyl-phosphate phosphoribosyltransferase n=1 Tax=Dictyobacter formicarum TaxID=2778368 RepID=A0ABQ3VCX0_9CHLR|nr:decaprenyl-phosphate phosphoribosyltransferase [Dictyobacter formicarum]GHO83321.1 decaprenyl-phosphate phosphoribosyltransferase [Dictyobacter formicarum]